MAVINDLATTQLLSNINDKNIENLSENKKKNISNGKNICIAAVKYNTIGNAYKDIMGNSEVYLLKEEKNGNMKTYAYSRCSKTMQDGNDYCHLHCRMMKYNKVGLKIFERDILPKDLNDKTRWLASVSDDYFENMGKRGAKKKNGENNYTFSDENDPILLILTHKKADLATKLSILATKLLKNNNFVFQEDINSSSIKKHNKENMNNLISMIPPINKSNKDNKINHPKSKSKDNKSRNNISRNISYEKEENKHNNNRKNEESENEESENEESENEEFENEEFENEKIEDDKSDNEEDDNEEDDNEEDEDNKSVNEKIKDNVSEVSEVSEVSDDDENVPCIPIYTNENKLLWYNIENKIIYEPDGDDGGEEIGILKEISKEYHTIKYNEKFYTVLKEFNIKNKEKDIKTYCCVLTNSLFNKELNFIGTRDKIKNNEYKFNFIN